MWEFLTKVYNGNNGGLGLLVAFCVLSESITRVAVAIVKRAKQ